MRLTKGEEAAYEARWRRVSEAQIEFGTELLEAEALWGPTIRYRAAAPFKCTAELYFWLGRWLNRRKRTFTPKDEQKMMSIIYEGVDEAFDLEGPSFSTRLTTAFDGIESEVRVRIAR